MTNRRAKLDELLKKAHDLPAKPGVYLMKDAEGVVLYIGKARALCNRVSSYFVPSVDLGPWKQQMLDIVDDFEVIICEDEVEALLSENRLIKDIQPRYNERLTDGKTYPFLAVTMKEDYPGVYITRSPEEEKFHGAKLFGPFTSVYAMREAINLLQRVFRFRTCHLDIREDDPKNRFFRPCLLYSIGQCTAPCANRINKDDYRRDIRRFIRFIESKRSVMLKDMRKEMERASAKLQFEKAAILRDQIKAIEKLDERARESEDWRPDLINPILDPQKSLEELSQLLGLAHPIRCMEGIDIAHLQGGETVGSKVCFIDGKPFKNEYRRYRIRGFGQNGIRNDDYSSIREVIYRRYREAGEGNELYPDVILIDGGLGQLHAALEAFDSLDIKPPMVISLAKKEELIYIQAESDPVRLGRENPALRLCQAVRDEAHRFAQHYHHLLRRKSVLGE